MGWANMIPKILFTSSMPNYARDRKICSNSKLILKYADFMAKVIEIHSAWIYKLHIKANRSVLHFSPENIIIGIHINLHEDQIQDFICLCIPHTGNCLSHQRASQMTSSSSEVNVRLLNQL